MSTGSQEPIAVIGMACRFPGGSNSPSKLWELLKSPRDLSQRVPSSRFDSAAYFHPNGSYHGATDSQDAYFLEEDVAHFDNGFFNIQPAEAEAIDPQQRLLLETVYDSLCDGGQTAEGLRGSDTAVYVGVMCDDWAQLINRDWEATLTYAATGESRAIVSNRISYFFDWHGPSMTIDTACSSSLVAVHQGVTALRSGECSVAIAAGANLILGPGMWIAESKLHMLSPTGTSKMWDAAADGYARGEGIAAVVLKKLSNALRDGDPIDCVIRGTGVNQDGRTPGLTMPSNIAQSELIRQTYARAGLDINDEKDRPQFFHAHGTGTPAGDPQEAQAIESAFFGDGKTWDTSDKISVGSIKTIIGHTEGSAGLASLIGTALALQHATIPPNLHFNKLNPRVAPFYSHLEIPTSSKPWPKLMPGQPRRASVNSFGFGGTNSHAILESFETRTSVKAVNTVPSTIFTPLTVSAGSCSALRAMLSNLKNYLELHPDTNMRDLCYTLQSRRSTLPYREVVVCSTVKEAISRIDGILAQDVSPGSGMTIRHLDVPKPSVLGVFTGQGAQWARMGAKLIASSPHASARIEELESALQRLPEIDRPDWSLGAEILANPELSRLSEAKIAQPLCTAIQIVLVDLLRAAQIQFSGVVGHSSGEIGAAYAAGYLSATDAICIAYYRGLYAHLAGSDGDIPGAMMAVGTTFEDAMDFCELDDYTGRIQIAARNSPTSITLSGDEDAIEEAVVIFAAEKRFARRLRVDVAYHSRHMLPCSELYRDALERCNITAQNGNGTRWFSSVVEGQVMTKEAVQDPQYWIDNMINTVMFAPAIETAVTEAGPFNLAIEVGPHPALKGPCLDTIDGAGLKRIPYTGVLGRNKDDMGELASALGFVWRQLGAASVDFVGFETQASGTASPLQEYGGLKDLPTYPFDHGRRFYGLTRYSGGSRNVHAPPHPLLGRRCVESETDKEISWRQLLRPNEISWLQGHQLQGQVVFPAMGYVAVALEAAAVIVGPHHTVGLMSLENIVIGRALTFDGDDAGMECKTTMSIEKFTDDELLARISCYSGRPFDGATPLALNFCAQVNIAFHEPAANTLPASSRVDSHNLVAADSKRLYSQFTSLGYNYSSPFTGVREIQRKMDFATGIIVDESGNDWEDQLLLHPGLLDSAIQTGFAAYCHPHDNRLWALQVPVSIQSIVVNPSFLPTTRDSARESRFRYQSTTRTTPNIPMVVDIDLFTEQDQEHPFVRFESVGVQPFAAATARDDACVFSRTEYKLATPDAAVALAMQDGCRHEDSSMLLASERIGFFHLRQVYEALTPSDKAKALPHYQKLLDNAGRLVDAVSKGEHATVPCEACNDSKSFIRSLIVKHSQHAVVKLLQIVGQHLETQIRRGGSMLEHMTEDALLSQFYEELGTYPWAASANVCFEQLIAQISHRYPRMRILEVGAGSGGATKGILSALDDAYETYTYTDVSDELLKHAMDRFESFRDRMVFTKYDMEKPPTGQGFEEGSYDIVLARATLHTAVDLGATLSNCRRLLKPGGYLVVGDFVSNDLVSIGAVMGSLPRWWIRAATGSDDSDGPCLTMDQWHKLSQECGFGGVEAYNRQLGSHLQYYSAWACQAVDDRVRSLRAPLTAPDTSPTTKRGHLFVVGGQKSATGTLAADTCALLHQRYSSIQQMGSLEELNHVGLSAGCSVLCLSELDEQLLEIRTESKLESLKNLWRKGRSILYVTRCAQDMSPYSGMLLGLSRVVRYEHPNINLQVLDFDSDTEPTAQVLAESLVRLELGCRWLRDEGRSDLLWSLEPELYYTKGQPLIPRVMPLVDANMRYNTYRRRIQKTVDPRKETVLIESVRGGSAFQLCVPSPLRVPPAPCSDKTRAIRIEYSMLHAVKIGESGFLSLAAGKDVATGESLVALLDTAPESLPVPFPSEWAVSVPEEEMSTTLIAIAAHLVAKSILGVAPRFGSIVVHEADVALRDALHREAVPLGLAVSFTTSKTADAKALVQCTFIHPKLPSYMVQQILPRGISYFVNMAPGCASAKLVSQGLQRNTMIRTAQDFLCASPGVNPGIVVQPICSALMEAFQSIAAHKYAMARARLGSAQVLSLKAIGSGLSTETKMKLHVVDWKTPSVEAVVKPIDHGSIFRSDMTYLLFGLAGDLGQSLCNWMVAHGARHIMLGSRQPRVSLRFIEPLTAAGATVKVMSVDLTSRESVHACYETVRREMPPVAGVANGALVLADALFNDLDFASFDKTARPKVDGSVLLDQLFYDTALDFFILFTSAVGVSGNTGQSAYIMANNFMTSLAAQRRDQRGVAGSAIALGAVAGLGQFERSGHLDRDHFTKMGYRDSSEQDCHRLFAEAILSGRPENVARGCSQIGSGLSPVRKTPHLQAQLRDDPRFGRFILPVVDHGRQATLNGSGATARPRVRLATAASSAEARTVVRDAFVSRLKRVLMIPADEQLNTNLTFVEQGLDSIMAVEVRTWFLSEVEVDLPVLQILGSGSTVDTLVDGVMDKIPTTILDWKKLQSGDSRPEKAFLAVVGRTNDDIPVSRDDEEEEYSRPAVATEPNLQVSILSSSSSDCLESQTSHTSTPPSTSGSDTPPPSTETSLKNEMSLSKITADNGEEQHLGVHHKLQKRIIDSSTELTAPMTFGQKGIWLLSHFVDDPTTFNMSIMGKLSGRIRVGDLSKAVETVAQRHESLRTRFYWSDDDARSPMQGVLSKPLMRLETAKITTAAEAMEELEAMQRYEWDLSSWAAVRLRLLSLSDTEHYMLMGANHIALDGHSYTVLMLDIEKAYMDPDLRIDQLPDTSQIRTFGAQQRMANETGRNKPALEYYRRIFDPKDLLLPIDLFSFARTRVRLPLTCYKTHTALQVLDHALASKLNQLARRRRATSFHAYLAALQALLFRLLPSNTTDKVFIGMADANRLDSKFMGSVGNFLNILPLRFDRTTRQSFGQAIETASTRVRSALQNSSLPFDLLLEELDVPRSSAWSPIFQVFIDYRLLPSQAGGRSWSGCSVTDETWRAAKSAYDVVLEIAEDKSETLLKIHVQDGLYDAQGAALLLKSYVNLLEHVAQLGDRIDVESLPKWDGADVAKALEMGQGQDMQLEWPSTVAHRIDQITALHPDSTAIKDGHGTVLTYSEMDQRVESVARILRQQLPTTGGKTRGHVVGVFQMPTADYICSLLAIHRFGGIYLPLDIRNGAARLESNVTAAGPTAILVDRDTSGRIGEIGVDDRRMAVIDVSSLPTSVQDHTNGRSSRKDVAAKPEDTAYIIFTSGSTGEPKGITVNHASLRANLEGYHRAWNIKSLATVMLQQSLFSFDASLLQIYAPLTTGGCLIVVPADARGDPQEVTRIMAEHGVTMTQATPSEYDTWFRYASGNLRNCTTWKAAWFGGERARPELLDGWRRTHEVLPGLRVFTSYGPTECTISATKGEVDLEDPKLTVPIPGRLLPNYKVFIVDEDMSPVPIGVSGQICLGGIGVASNEYFNQPDLTAMAFRDGTGLTQLSCRRGPCERIYQTGDYGRLSEDGRLTIEGRIAGDTQVKLRGFRIELEEIERIIVKESAGLVTHAILTLREDVVNGKETFLAAHIVLDKQNEREDELRSRSRSSEAVDRLRLGLPLRIPQYMCPSVIVPLDSVPLTAHAKVDRRAILALPLPIRDDEAIIAERQDQQDQRLTHTEHRLARLWIDILPPQQDPLTRASDFFLCGGNSLVLVRLQALIKQKFLETPRLIKLMNAPGLASMAALIDISGSAVIDWDKEIALGAQEQTSWLSPRDYTIGSQQGRCILVTGATGHIGHRVVAQLAQNEGVRKILCLVRAAEGRHLPSLFAGMDKVQMFSTELPHLVVDALELSEVDMVLHCAANRTFWDSYTAAKPVNVDAVKALADLCLRNGASLHIMSSGNTAAYESDASEPGAPLPRPSPGDGYIASKWVAERYLARAARQLGLRVTVHRLSQTAQTDDAVANGFEDHKIAETGAAIVQAMLDAAVRINARPDFTHIDGGWLDVTPLAELASAITLAMTAEPDENRQQAAGMRIISYPAASRVLTDALAASTAALLGKAENKEALSKLPLISGLQFVGLAKRARLFDWVIMAQEITMTDDNGQRIVTRR